MLCRAEGPFKITKMAFVAACHLEGGFAASATPRRLPFLLRASA
jgi:hypothetical protein